MAMATRDLQAMTHDKLPFDSLAPPLGCSGQLPYMMADRPVRSRTPELVRLPNAPVFFGPSVAVPVRGSLNLFKLQKCPKVDSDPKNGIITKLLAPNFCAECTDGEIHSSHGDPFHEYFCVCVSGQLSANWFELQFEPVRSSCAQTGSPES